MWVNQIININYNLEISIGIQWVGNMIDYFSIVDNFVHNRGRCIDTFNFFKKVKGW